MPAARRASSAAGPRRRFRRAPAGLAVLALALSSGCALWNKKPAPAPAVPPPPPVYVAPAHRGIGRVLSHDATAGVALVELSPFATVPSDLAGRALIARDPATLAPTARLVASSRRSGAVVGAYVVEGAPSPDDEVALTPVP